MPVGHLPAWARRPAPAGPLHPCWRRLPDQPLHCPAPTCTHLLRQHGLLPLHQRHVAHQARVLLAQAGHLDLQAGWGWVGRWGGRRVESQQGGVV